MEEKKYEIIFHKLCEADQHIDDFPTLSEVIQHSEYIKDFIDRINEYKYEYDMSITTTSL